MKNPKKVSEILEYVIDYLSHKDLDAQTYEVFKLLEEFYNVSCYDGLDDIYKIENGFVVSYVDDFIENKIWEG